MLTEKVIRGSRLVIGGQLGIRLLDFLAVIITARYIFPEDFGLVALGSTTLIVLNSVTNFPVFDALIRQSAVDQEDIDTAFTLNAIRGTILAFLIIALAQPIAQLYNDDRLIPIVFVLSSAVLAQGFISPGMTFFIRKLNFKPQIVLQIFSKIASVMIMIILAIWLGSYWAIIIGIISIPIVTTVGSYYYKPYRPRLSFAKWRGLVDFAGWITVANTMSTANMYGDRFFIGGILGPAQLGSYYQGSTISQVLTGNFISSLSHTFYSAFSKLQNDQARLRGAFLRTQYAVALVMFPLGTFLGALSEPIVSLALGPNWQLAGSLLAWLFPSEALLALVVPVQALILSSGHTRYLAIREFVFLFIRLAPIVIAAFFIGLYGAVVARTLAGLVILILNFYLARKIIGVPVLLQIGVLARPTIGSAMVYLSIWTLQASFSYPEDLLMLALYIFVAFFFAFSVYCITIMLLWMWIGYPSGPERRLMDFLFIKQQQ